MNNVKRYITHIPFPAKGRVKTGDFCSDIKQVEVVLASDYDALRAELESLKAQEPVAFKVEHEGQDGERVVFYSDSINDFRKNPPDFGEVQSLYASPVVTEGGYVLAPLKPTIEMVEAGYEISLGQPDRSAHARVTEQYEAMMAELLSSQQTPTDNTETLRNALASDLLRLLEQAVDDIEFWGAYASAYAQKKHGLSECVAKYRSAIQNRLSQQSEPQASVDWPKLEKPAQVNGARFSVGLSARLVVEAAYRFYEYSQQPEIEAERIEKLRNVLAMVNPQASAVPQPPSPFPSRSLVMPERKVVNYENVHGIKRYNPLAEGWNDCLDEFARLNAVQQEKK